MQSNSRSGASTTSSHGQGVNATTGGLIKATLGAAIAAGAILTFVWLPAEYGIDPTGVGQVLGLTQMGLIKEQLHAEAEAEAAADTAASATAADTDANTDAEKAGQSAQTGPADPDIAQQLEAIQMQLALIATTVGAPTTEAGAQSALAPQTASSVEPAAVWRDEVEFTLTPGEGIEIKMVMNEGAVATFEWSANGALVNHDTHGDGEGQSISYEKGRSVPEQTGELTAAFTGNHGWFWRNRTEDSVLISLRTRGDYEKLLVP